ncbi:MAG: LacI family DNA-binding transcriptional regulator [Paracoccaceae bacterium]
MSEQRAIPTLEDVARAAGVSTATVSRCLNAPERVQQRTRLRVEKAIEQLGYTPNFAAQVMAAKRTHTIGAVIPTMENAIFARGIQAFQEALHASGYTLLIASSAYRPEVEAEQIRQLVARGADGLLLIGQDRDEAVYRYLKRRNVPALIAWAYAEDSPLTCVGFDNHQAMRALAEQVLDLGHRRIAMISGITDGNDRARQRLYGVRAALAASGLDPADLPVVETRYAIECGGEAFDQLMAREPSPTAIMCGNDVLAVGALKRARERNIRVPADVSITGFDDIELAQVIEPALSTVHVPHREMGRRAAEELVALVEGKSDGGSIEVYPSIQTRASLGQFPTAKLASNAIR